MSSNTGAATGKKKSKKVQVKTVWTALIPDPAVTRNLQRDLLRHIFVAEIIGTRHIFFVYSATHLLATLPLLKCVALKSVHIFVPFSCHNCRARKHMCHCQTWNRSKANCLGT